MLWAITLGVLACGAIGGAVATLIGTEGTKKAAVRFTITAALWNTLLGAVAALVVWAVYGPMASLDIIRSLSDSDLHLTIGQMAAAFLTGMAGRPILIALRDKHAAQVNQAKMGKALVKSQKDVKALAGRLRELNSFVAERTVTRREQEAAEEAKKTT